MIQPGQVLVVKRELGLSKRLQDDPALAADLVQMGIDQTSPCLAAPPDDDRRNRCCESSSVCLPPEQLAFTVTSGTPGCITKVGMILSTGLPETLVTACQKSAEVALPLAWAFR